MFYTTVDRLTFCVQVTEAVCLFSLTYFILSLGLKYQNLSVQEMLAVKQFKLYFFILHYTTLRYRYCRILLEQKIVLQEIGLSILPAIKEERGFVRQVGVGLGG